MQGPHRGHDHGPSEIDRRLLHALAIAGAAALVAVPTAGAGAPRVVLPLNDPASVQAGEPPLAGAGPGEREPQLFRQRVDSREHVTVGVDGSGRPVSVSVVQRLRVIGKGDYLYTVPAPVLSVAATADSESAPGQRSGAILWSGFSPRVRLLGARARLGLAHAAAFLPLRISLRVKADEVVLTLRNATSTRLQSASARGDVHALERVLAMARRRVYPYGGVGLSVLTPVKARTVAVEAPLAVRGELSFPAGQRLQFSLVLGDGRPLSRVLRFSGHATRVAPPTLQLTVKPTLPQRTLATGPKPSSVRLLEVAEDAYLRAARVHQYDTFLANPGLNRGSSVADYTYVSAAPHAEPRVVARHGGGLGTLGIVLVVGGGIVLVGGLAVAWAHL